MNESAVLKIVLIDRDASVADALQTEAGRRYEIIRHDGYDEVFHQLLSDQQVGTVITEQLVEGELTGLEALTTLKKRRPHLPTLMVSDVADSSIAIQAVQSGAYDFLPKPVDAAELLEIIDEAIESYGANARKVSIAPPPSESEPQSDSIVGRSRAMTHVYRDIARIAATPVTTLIRGETGSGKELIARALHQHGHRAHLPLISVNCAAIPENLLESELFGHEKGAFTGATSTRIGRFEQAHGATLFLDEIGDMDLALQAKLLRVLQEKVIERVGSNREIPVDVRFIAATHRSLETMIDRGEFREDLFYRLNAASIVLPPLRERAGDVRVLVEHFLHLYARQLGIGQPSLTANALSLLERNPWPGNVRQLQNVIRRALIKRRDFTIRSADIHEFLSFAPIDHAGDASLTALADAVLDDSDGGAYRSFQNRTDKVLLTRAMQRCDGNLSKAAKWLGITRYTLREKLRQLDSPRP